MFRHGSLVRRPESANLAVVNLRSMMVVVVNVGVIRVVLGSGRSEVHTSMHPVLVPVNTDERALWTDVPVQRNGSGVRQGGRNDSVVYIRPIGGVVQHDVPFELSGRVHKVRTVGTREQHLGRLRSAGHRSAMSHLVHRQQASLVGAEWADITALGRVDIPVFGYKIAVQLSANTWLLCRNNSGEVFHVSTRSFTGRFATVVVIRFDVAGILRLPSMPHSIVFFQSGCREINTQYLDAALPRSRSGVEQLDMSSDVSAVVRPVRTS